MSSREGPVTVGFSFVKTPCGIVKMAEAGALKFTRLKTDHAFTNMNHWFQVPMLSQILHFAFLNPFFQLSTAGFQLPYRVTLNLRLVSVREQPVAVRQCGRVSLYKSLQ
jgi:hypothetical protein